MREYLLLESIPGELLEHIIERGEGITNFLREKHEIIEK